MTEDDESPAPPPTTHTKAEDCDWRCRERYEQAHRNGLCGCDQRRAAGCAVANLRRGQTHEAPPLCAYRFSNCGEPRVRGSHLCRTHT
jgi:hypothetical protein